MNEDTYTQTKQLYMEGVHDSEHIIYRGSFHHSMQQFNVRGLCNCTIRCEWSPRVKSFIFHYSLTVAKYIISMIKWKTVFVFKTVNM